MSLFGLSHRELRTRLTAGLVALLMLACAVVGVATTLALRAFLVNRLDQQLSAASDRVARGFRHADGDEFVAVPGQSVGTLAVRVVAGRIVRAAIVEGDGDDDGDDAATLGAADRARLLGLAADRAPQTVHFDRLGDYRVEAAREPDGDIEIAGLPLRPVHDTVERLQAVEAVVFAVVLLVAGVAGAWWIRRSLRPLRQVAATATQVSQLPLAEGHVELPDRVPEADPRTEVGRVGVAFNRMLAHVERALASRHASEDRLRRFVADASHELRTPLAAIRGHAELARRSHATVPPDVAQSLQRIEAESRRMGALVDDLLLLARLDAGRELARDPVDVTRLAIDLVGDARVAGRDHSWRLDLPEEPVEVCGDERRLRQVIGNLLANARVHTPPGTTVTTRIVADGEEVGIRVCDDGPGIPESLQPAVFERFVRGDSSRSRVSGSTGLGLAIVFAVAEAHGGRVAVSSRPGDTEFAVQLPRYDAAAAVR